MNRPAKNRTNHCYSFCSGFSFFFPLQLFYPFTVSFVLLSNTCVPFFLSHSQELLFCKFFSILAIFYLHISLLKSSFTYLMYGVEIILSKFLKLCNLLEFIKIIYPTKLNLPFKIVIYKSFCERKSLRLFSFLSYTDFYFILFCIRPWFFIDITIFSRVFWVFS